MVVSRRPRHQFTPTAINVERIAASGNVKSAAAEMYAVSDPFFDIARWYDGYWLSSKTVRPTIPIVTSDRKTHHLAQARSIAQPYMAAGTSPVRASMEMASMGLPDFGTHLAAQPQSGRSPTTAIPYSSPG